MTPPSSFPYTGTGDDHPPPPSHPGTSGRSPPPSHRGGGGGAIVGGASGGASSGGGGGGVRNSIGSSSNAGEGSVSSMYSRRANRGTRLSYGGVVVGGGGSAPPPPGRNGAVPIVAIAPAATPANEAHRPSTSSTTTTATNDDDDADGSGGRRRPSRSDFLAALSPATAKFLRRRGFGGNDVGGGGGGGGASTGGGGMSFAASDHGHRPGSIADVYPFDIDMGNDVAGNDDDDAGEGRGGPERWPATTTNDDPPTDDDDETTQLRRFVRSLLGMHPSQSPSSLSSSSFDAAMPPLMTTPDPATAAFFAVALLAKTDASASLGFNDELDNRGVGGGSFLGQVCRWRPDDAYLAARALSLNGEHKRAIYVLDRVGLVGFGMGESNGNGGVGPGNAGGAIAAGTSDGSRQESSSSTNDNARGVRNALLLRTESALLAGQCLVRAGEYERALTVYEESMRFPPPPPPAEWGRYGYGYVLNGGRRRDSGVDDGRGGEEEGGDEAELNASLADEAYVRSWREQSLSHTALIDDGDDERLMQLAANVRELPFSCDPHHDNCRAASMTMAMEGIHPVARLCAARGIAYDAISNPHRAVQFLRAAMTIDPRCVEALDYAVKSRLLTPEEEREWISGLKFGDGKYGTADDKEGGGYWSSMGMSWLRDAYLARLHGIGGLDAPNLPSDSLQGQSVDQTAANIMSPVPRSDLQSPSMLSLGSPDFAGGDVGRDANEPLATLFASSDKAAVAAAKASGISLTVDGAFRNLAIKHNLGRSPDILSHAAIRSYALHDLHSALAYCTAIDSIDPYCRTAGYVHVATLVGLNLKRRLFQLAHRLVDTDPKDSLAWFAVGSYYYACRRYDLAQRHFSRSTRLDPRSAECWIGFGCSFAVCDESDQALASFRAAQNKNSGSHVPLLYMGMEYLRTNHLSLAGHFLNSAQRTDPCDMLCCNELGVWCYRQGNLVDAAFWFMKALRLHARTESTVLSSTDEGLGMNGYILLTGQSGKWGGRTYTAVVNEDASTPYFKRRSSGVSTVLCALKTPSGQSIAASSFGDNINVDNDALSDMECIDRCMDQFWEPTIFNLGQSYRKMNRYGDAIVCFEKCSSLNPGNHAAHAALGFSKHLGGDVDGAIDSYHEALSRKPEDAFTSEMLLRALSEAVTYPPSLAMLSSLHPGEEVDSGGVGSSILKKMESGFADNKRPVPPGYYDHDDVDMSLV